mmetsp:Transcript_26885/g.53702  ORF Transcript_26885/g.53702 Transcript_26885/m.53702 type:complete len:422 (-) Transcript_26885:195-1460(-)|eukprot:CAMPEP_0194334458 /NCGR_PEP_ID=MMETSP0171-20130528/66181_1 /TAXON_ID=218684 /ORGANISM="Corethron pennatum, Strain L29A3" /LENGTH=421 /DNA_ID=CAMNT_0039097107 /DNA_START=147 /DNA_END=1412 /DNA_ORIENTATION=+
MVKQRKGKKSQNQSSSKDENYNADKDKAPRGKREKGKHKSNKHEVSFRTMLLFMTCFLGFVGAVLYYFYSLYGINILLGKATRDFNWTPYMWRKFMDDNEKKILLIGGPHRSGTTILWEAIKAHPDVGGFGGRFETGVDFSEGVLLQDVYPKFGVGMEFKNFGRTKQNGEADDTKMEGLGRYALHPDVHWTKESKRELLENPNTLSTLLNRFAPYWNTNRKFQNEGLKKASVLVEKSPQNGVLSTFLEGLYNMPVNEDGSVGLTSGAGANAGADKKKRLMTKFLYITRHPIANIYAIDKLVSEAMGGHINFETNLRNYIQLHKYMKMDEKALDSPVMWARLEDFTTDPKKILVEIFDFLDVNCDEKAIAEILDGVGEIRSDPNGKYMKKWCDEGKKKHGHLFDKYAEELKALDLGYDLEIC